MNIRKLHPWASLLLVWALLAGADRAWGWGSTWLGANLEQVMSAARWRVGSLRVFASFRLDNVGYDSDLYYGNLAAPVPDYTATAGPQVHLYYPVLRSLVLEVYEYPRYDFFLRTKNERAWGNQFNGRVHFVLDKFYIEVGQGLSNARQRLSQELGIRVRGETDDFNSLILWQVSRGTSFAATYRQLKYDYGNLTFNSINIGQTLNRTEHYADVMAYFQQATLTRFYLNGQYGDYRFAESAATPRDSRSYSASGGVEFLPAVLGQEQTSGIQGRFDIGYKRLVNILHVFSPYGGIIANTNVTAGVFPLTLLRGFFLRDIQFSAFSDFNYYIRSLYGVGLTYLVSKRLDAGYELSLGRDHYPLAAVTGGAAFRNDDTRSHTFQAVYKVRQDLQIGFTASLGKRTSSLFGLSRNRNFFGLNLVYGYAQPDNPLLTSPFTQY